MKLSDFKGIFKKELLEVIEVKNQFKDYYTVKLSFPTEMTWIPGEHGIFSLQNRKIRGKSWRAFSIASNPDEGFLLIGTRTGEKISNFKKELISLKKGDIVKIQGPFGWFKLTKNDLPVVLIAGGVGITPIRSLLTTLKNKKRVTKIIYTSKEFHLFENDINNIIKNNDLITLEKTNNSGDTIKKIKSTVKDFNNEAKYYISGSMSFIKSVKSNLKSLGIKSRNIINDPFL